MWGSRPHTTLDESWRGEARPLSNSPPADGKRTFEDDGGAAGQLPDAEMNGNGPKWPESAPKREVFHS